MKKGLLTICFVALSLIFLVNVVSAETNVSNNQSCVKRDGKCCIGNVCSAADVQCITEATAKFNGCTSDCIANWTCETNNTVYCEINPYYEKCICKSGTKKQYKCPVDRVCREVFSYICTTGNTTTCSKKGAMCGGIQGKTCCGELKCKMAGNYPDASGVCKEEDNDNENTTDNDHCIGNCTQEREREKRKNRLRNIKREQIKEELKKQIEEKKELKFENRTGQTCLENCSCQGVVMRCELDDGTRQMTIFAMSGNKIIVTKGINASTKVELYRANGTLVGIFSKNESKIIKITPEQIDRKIIEKIQSRLEKQNITLSEDGYYTVTGRQSAKLFGLFNIKKKMNWKIDPETGEIIKTKTSWWGFLARDVKTNQIMGASCGTVTPGQNDACCQTKGYDFWNSDKKECVFNQ